MPLLLGAVLWWPARATASSCVTLELFLYNLTDNQITANWVDESGNMVSLPVADQTVVYIGQPCINVSGGKGFALSIADPADGFIDAEYSINAEDCLAENWLAAQSAFPTECANPQFNEFISYYIDSDRQYVCLQGPQGSPAQLSPNAALGTTALHRACDAYGDPTFSVQFNDYSGDRFTWPIALGTFAPTAGQGLSAQPVLPGVSPSGVTPCVGSVCVVPDHDDDYNFWPVTIYWYATAGGVPGFTFNSQSSFQLGAGSGGLNIPSQLSNYLSTDADDVYVPPAASTVSNFPAPCWPTFDSNGNLMSCAPTATNVPAYVANPNAKSGLAQSILKISNDVVTGLVDIITIGGVF